MSNLTAEMRIRQLIADMLRHAQEDRWGDLGQDALDLSRLTDSVVTCNDLTCPEIATYQLDPVEETRRSTTKTTYWCSRHVLDAVSKGALFVISETDILEKLLKVEQSFDRRDHDG